MNLNPTTLLLQVSLTPSQTDFLFYIIVIACMLCFLILLAKLTGRIPSSEKLIRVHALLKEVPRIGDRTDLFIQHLPSYYSQFVVPFHSRIQHCGHITFSEFLMYQNPFSDIFHFDPYISLLDKFLHAYLRALLVLIVSAGVRANHHMVYPGSMDFIHSVFLSILVFNLPYSKCLRRRSLFEIKPLTATAHMNFYFPSKSELKKKKKCNCYTLVLAFMTISAIVGGFALQNDAKLITVQKKDYLLHEVFCFVLAFASNFWINSYFFIVPKDDNLKEWCSTMDVRVLEAGQTIQLFLRRRRERIEDNFLVNQA